MLRYVLIALLLAITPAAAQFSGGGFSDNGGSPPSTPSGAAGGGLCGTYPNPTVCAAVLNFKVHLSANQSVSGVTKILYDVVDFDATTAWSVTNHNFNPQTAGTYLICSSTNISGTIINSSTSAIYVSKNGIAGGAGTAIAYYPQTYQGTITSGAPQSGCVLVPMNGTSDTIEVDVTTATITSPVISGSAAPNIQTYLTGHRIGP